MTDWLRLWHDMPTDPKWRVISRKSGQPLPFVIAVFNVMLVNASANSADRGTLSNWNDEDAGAALDMGTEAVAAIRDAMQGKVLDGGRLMGWEKRQPKREDGTAAKRKQEWRERQTEKKNATERNGTQRNAPDTDKDTEVLEPNGSCPSDDGLDLKPEHVVESWNELAGRIGKPKAKLLTPERRVRVKARIAGYTIDEFRQVLSNIERSPFLRGDRNWQGCTFDWFTKKANFQKILEGNYNGH